MLLTLGVKNLFGCVVGMKKPEWHLRAGVDREMFADLLLKIFQAIKPSFTLIDGILAMEGQGPGKGGTPKELGVLMGSTDTIAIDNIVCRMLGIGPDMLLTNKIAAEQGLAAGEIFINGDLPVINDFKLPEITPLVFGPERFHGFMRRHLVQRPECDDKTCKLCGECWNYCPADAIANGKEKISFDYDKCIRCYCCIEVCPHAALSANETAAGKVARKLLKMKVKS
jgi:ferredoxin